MRTRDIPWQLSIQQLVEVPEEVGPQDSPGRRPAPSLPWTSAGRGRPIRASQRCGRKCGYHRWQEPLARRKCAARRIGNSLRESVEISPKRFGPPLNVLDGANLGQASSKRGLRLEELPRGCATVVHNFQGLQRRVEIAWFRCMFHRGSDTQMTPQDVAAWHAEERLPRQESHAARLRKYRGAGVHENCQDGPSTRARIPGGLADRLPRRGTPEWSSQEGHVHWGILDQAERLCEIQRPQARANARWCKRARLVRVEQRNLPWSHVDAETIAGHRRNAWLSGRQSRESRKFQNPRRGQ